VAPTQADGHQMVINLILTSDSERVGHWRYLALTPEITPAQNKT
jgi:hypothetical protein